MKKIFVIALILALCGSMVSQAQTPTESQNTVDDFLENLISGNYDWNYYGYGAGNPFRILKRGDEIRIVDQNNKLTHSLNVRQNEPQSISAEYLTFLQNAPKTKAVASLIKAATIENVRAGLNKGEIIGTAKIYINYQSHFGSLTGTISFDASVIAEKCKVKRYANNTSTTHDGTCLFPTLGTGAQLKNIKTSFPVYDKVFGMLLDILLRLNGLDFAPAPIFGTST